jgi:glucan-binding YG repeat protein
MDRQVKITSKDVTLDGKLVEPGTVITLSEESARAAVKGKYGEYADKGVQVETPPVETDEERAAREEKERVAKEEAERLQAEEAHKKTFNAINGKYNKEDLKAKAQEAGVEFGFDDNKDVIVEKIIAQGKAELFI